ncbi:MAG: signal peptidase I [Ruminococcus sp.]|nr:signal peptidase I [Ruminococcus sp.]
MREYIRFSRNTIVHRIAVEILDMLDMMLLTIFCIIMLFTYVFHVATVQGSSMVPTLTTEDKLLVNNFSGEPQAGDILIIGVEEATLMQSDGSLYTADGLGKTIVKRVIAVGGQELNIDFDAGKVYVDGVQIEENYVNNLTTVPQKGGAFTYPITIPEGYIFVMGDNRDVSLDSRYSNVGLVPESDVVGKVLLRIYPWSQFGPV